MMHHPYRQVRPLLVAGIDWCVERMPPLGWRDVLTWFADVIVFALALHAGWHLSAAQFTSFAIGLIIGLGLSGRGAWGLGKRSLPFAQWAGIGMVTLMAVLLRGGVLFLLIERAGLAPQLAILAAILASTLVTQFGFALLAPVQHGRVGQGVDWQAVAIALAIYALLLRWLYVGQVELLPEEAYYWNYAQHLDMGYLDHPPMVAWLIGLGTAAFGDTQFGVRVGALLCSLVTSLFVYRTTQELFGKTSAWLAVVLLQLLPGFFLSGFFLTPDAPLTAAWAAGLYFLQRALLTGRVSGWWWAGVCLGVGLNSKYTMLLLVLSALLFMAMDSQARRWLRQWVPYAALLLGLVLFAPVIVWNAEHDWASFAFQTSRRLAEAPRFSLHKLLASALILLTPAGLLTLPAALSAQGSGPGDPLTEQFKTRRLRFFRVFTLTPLSVFALFSLFHEVKFDWTEALWLAAIPPLAYVIECCAAGVASRTVGWLRGWWRVTVLATPLLFAAGLYYLTLGLPGVGYSRRPELLPVAWRDLGRQIDGLARAVRVRSGLDPLVVGMNRYMLASELAFYVSESGHEARDIASQHLFDGEALMYEQWYPKSEQEGRTLLLVAWTPDDLADDVLQAHVQTLGPVTQGRLSRDGSVIANYFYRVAEGYHSSPKSP